MKVRLNGLNRQCDNCKREQGVYGHVNNVSKNIGLWGDKRIKGVCSVTTVEVGTWRNVWSIGLCVQ